MKNYVRFDTLVRGFLKDILDADSDFKLEQIWYRNKTQVKALIQDGTSDGACEAVKKYLQGRELDPDQLCISELKINLNLKEYQPFWLIQLFLKLKHCILSIFYKQPDPVPVYKIVSATDLGMAVTITVKRLNAFDSLEVSCEPDLKEGTLMAL